MALSPNKGLSLQSSGSGSGVWGVGASTALNEGCFTPIDLMLGGFIAESASASPITITGSDAQNMCVRVTGTLTSNVQITTDNLGFFFIENLTSGSFALTVKNSSNATAATIPQGCRVCILSDATNGCRIGSQSGFETGVKIAAFQMATAPVGWTKDTTNNNKALRLVSGSGGGTGGTQPFTTAFATGRTLTGSTASTVLTTSNLPSHAHQVAAAVSTGASDAAPTNTTAISYNFQNGTSNSNYSFKSDGSTLATVGISSLTGSGVGHTHDAGTLAVAMDVQYVDLISATKD